MTVKECYSTFHGNYEEVLERLSDDKRIQKFLFMFLKDEHFDKLCEAMENGDCREAFLNAHAMKGVCANLSMTALFNETSELTELLRNGEFSEQASEYYERARKLYELTKDAIGELKNGE